MAGVTFEIIETDTHSKAERHTQMDMISPVFRHMSDLMLGTRSVEVRIVARCGERHTETGGMYVHQGGNYRLLSSTDMTRMLAQLAGREQEFDYLFDYQARRDDPDNYSACQRFAEEMRNFAGQTQVKRRITGKPLNDMMGGDIIVTETVALPGVEVCS